MAEAVLKDVPEDAFVRLETVLTILPFSHDTIFRLIEKNQFPKPTKLSPRVSAWRCRDLKEWIEAREKLSN